MPFGSSRHDTSHANRRVSAYRTYAATVSAAESVQKDGMSGVDLAKRWLESTTWVELPFDVYNNAPVCSLRRLGGKVQRYDLFGAIHTDPPTLLYVDRQGRQPCRPMGRRWMKRRPDDSGAPQKEKCMISREIRGLDFDSYLQHIRCFTDEELIPREIEMVDAGEVPADLVERMAQVGLFGITLPREWGGLGWTVEQQVLLTLEFTRASCVYRSRFSTTIGLCSQVLLDYGTAAQRTRHLAAMAGGDRVASFALTEPEAGSDAGAVTTTAVRDGDHYVLNGHKRYITNAAWADLLIVFARTEQGPSAFLVELPASGVSTRLPHRMNGHEAGPVAEIDLVGVRVPAENLIGGEEGVGLRQALRGINHARTHVAATAVGQATRLLSEATRHAMHRSQFGTPLADLGAVESMLGRSYAEMVAGRALVLDCAREFDTGPIPHHRIAAAKLFCTEMASEVADRAVQILGGEGIVGDSPVPRMWRDVRALRIYEGASQIHERNLARHLKSTVGDGGGV